MWGCIITGAFLTLASVYELWHYEAWGKLWPLLLLAIAAEFLGVRIYEAGHDRISYSLSAAATLLIVTALPMGVPLVSFLAAGVHTLMINRKRDVQRTLFNVGNPPLAAGAAVMMFLLVRQFGDSLSLIGLIGFLATSLTFWVFNSGYISAQISLHTRRPILAVLRQSGGARRSASSSRTRPAHSSAARTSNWASPAP